MLTAEVKKIKKALIGLLLSGDIQYFNG